VFLTQAKASQALQYFDKAIELDPSHEVII